MLTETGSGAPGDTVAATSADPAGVVAETLVSTVGAALADSPVETVAATDTPGGFAAIDAPGLLGDTVATTGAEGPGRPTGVGAAAVGEAGSPGP